MQVTSLLRKLVAFDTTSDRSNLRLINWAVDHFESFGARVHLTYDTTDSKAIKANLLATFGPEDARGVLLSGHTDVVPIHEQRWSSDPFSMREKDGRLYGRGTTDMKGFIAACLASCVQWQKAPLSRPVHVALTHSEEIGCHGVHQLVRDLEKHISLPVLAIVGEPTDMRVVDRHPGYLAFRSIFHGKAAHSSEPGNGASAIAAAARFIARIEEAPPVPDGDGGSTTFNVGRIHGGTNINIVPSRCDVLWEARPEPDADLQALRRAAHKASREGLSSDVTVESEEIITVPPLKSRISDEALKTMFRLTGEDHARRVPYGSEAGFFQTAGIPTVLCGPGSIDQAHQEDEWISIKQLRKATRFLSRLTDWAVRP